jgi:nucleoside-diphosphate-sugar epimerase
MSKTYLVTGGAGFIGSHLSERLIREGHSVRVLDDFSSGKIENLESVRDKVEIIRGDVRDINLVREAMDGVEVVFHQAAIGSVPRSVADPLATHEANITGTLNVLMAARDAGVRRVIYASSSSVYGEGAQLPKREDMMPQPLSPYALSKLAGEYYCAVFYRVYGLESVSLRYFNIFGPRQDPTSQYAAVIPRFIAALIEGQPPIIYGDGMQSRDFTYVENAVEANLLAAEARGVAGRAFNVACGNRYTLLELLDRLKRIIGCRVEPLHEAPRPGDIRHSQASIEAAKAALGYRVAVDFDEGLRRTVEWYKAAAPSPCRR